MTAILKEDPPDPDKSGVVVAPGVLRTLRRCLEKRPEERFQSARDLAFALESAMEISSASGEARRRETAATEAPEPKFGPTSRRDAVLPDPGRGAGGYRRGGDVAAAACGHAASSSPSSVAWRSTWARPRRALHARRPVGDLRRGLERRSAADLHDPHREPESVRLSLPDARLLSISKSGELAISLGHVFEGWMGMGTLARSSMLGSAPRVLLENIREAEWSPDGAESGHRAPRRRPRTTRVSRRSRALQVVGLHQRHPLFARWRAHRLCRHSLRCLPTMRARCRSSISRRTAHGVVGWLDLGPRPGVVGRWHGGLVHGHQRWRGTGCRVRRDAGRPAAGGDDESDGHEAVRHRAGRPRAAGPRDGRPPGRGAAGGIDRAAQRRDSRELDQSMARQRRLAPHDLRSDDAALHRLRPAGGRRRAGRARRRQLVWHLARRTLGARAAGDGRAGAAASRPAPARRASCRIPTRCSSTPPRGCPTTAASSCSASRQANLDAASCRTSRAARRVRSPRKA